MISVEVDSYEGWRDAARGLLHQGVPPEEVDWTGGEESLFGADDTVRGAAVKAPRVPKTFGPLAESAACFRSPDRWPLLYRILWRLNHDEAHLLEIASDPDVIKLKRMASEVGRDIHKMHAFVRFRKIHDADGQELFVAWHEPTHLVVERATPFFARRFAAMRWSILGPDRCAYWDGRELTFGPGLTRAHAPTGDEMEELWGTYYRHIFNPARIKLGAMMGEMPKKYWHTMPETALIPEMLAEAGQRVEQMMAYGQELRDGVFPADAAAEVVEAGGTLAELHALVKGCQACELYKRATQAVVAEGPHDARLMMVGEQPGDQEDRQGRPFVGPAGQLLRETMRAAGVDPEAVYLSNTVKHFRWEPSPNGGKRRIHQRATSRQIATCQGWVEGEIQLVKPQVLVCLGATAAQALLGPDFRLGRDRGRWLTSPLAPRVMATVHPSFLLRIQDPDEKERQRALFLADLRLAASALG